MTHSAKEYIEKELASIMNLQNSYTRWAKECGIKIEELQKILSNMEQIKESALEKAITKASELPIDNGFIYRADKVENSD